jgi:hypothetical protein
METAGNIQAQEIVYLLISCVWISLTVAYISAKSHAGTTQTVASLFCSLFFIYVVMPQIEILFFDTFYVTYDINRLLLGIGNTIPVIIAVWLGNKFFGIEYTPSKYSREPEKFTFTDLFIKWLLTGVIYMFIYFVAGYFLFWRIGANHIFYHGENHNTGLIIKTVEIWNTNPLIYLISFIKGLLYGLFLLPVIHLFRKRTFPMLISLVLLLETPAIDLIIPDFLFPNALRTGNPIEITGSLFLFAVLVWVLFDQINTSLRTK